MTETLLLILEIKQPSELQEPTSIRKSEWQKRPLVTKKQIIEPISGP